MRIIQRFDPRHEREFMALERHFAELEASRADYPKGRRLQPIAADEPTHSLVWEGEFPDLNAAHQALDLFSADSAHEALLEQQLPFFEEVRIEFYKQLDFE
jgi:hypothetical protein